MTIFYFPSGKRTLKRSSNRKNYELSNFFYDSGKVYTLMVVKKGNNN